MMAGSGFDTVSTGGALDWGALGCVSGCEALGSPLAKEPLILVSACEFASPRL